MLALSQKFIVIDQSLRDYSGHHFEYTKSAARALKNAGSEVEVWAHQDFKPLADWNFATLSCFTDSWTVVSNWRFLAALLWYLFASSWCILPVFLQSDFLQILVERTKSIKSENQHLFIHTLNWAQLFDIICLLKMQSKVELYFHILLRQDPTEKNRFGLKFLALKSFFILAKSHVRQIRFCTDTLELKLEFEKISGWNFCNMPIIFNFSPLVQSVGFSANPSLKLKVGYLGDARTEKGYLILPKIVRTLLDKRVPVEFFLQTNSAPNALFDSEIKQATQDLHALAQMYSEKLQLFTKPLNENEFFDLLLACDLVLLPYDKNQYARRSSGILAQAIFAEKICLVPAETTLAKILRSDSIVIYEEIGELVDKVEWIALQKEKLLSAAKIAKLEWIKLNNDKVFSNLLMSKFTENKFET